MNIAAYNYLTVNRLKDGVDILYKDAKKLYDWELLSRLEALRTNYRYMLQYINDGVEDPDASEMYQKLLREGFDCLDRSAFLENAQKYPQFYNSYFSHQAKNLKEYCLALQAQAQTMRETGAFDADLYDCSEEVIKQFAKYAELIDNIFNIIYLSPAWTEEEKDIVLSLFKTGLVDTCGLDVIVSAVNVCLLQHFDMLKYNFLVDVYLSDTYEQTRLKALIGFYLVINMQEERFMVLKEMWDPVYKLAELEDGGYTSEIIPIIHAKFWMSKYTDKYDKELNSEMIPSMMEAQNKYPQYIEALLKGSLPDEIFDSDPEMKKIIKKADKMRKKLIANHEYGVDTYFTYFKHIKNHRFFLKPSHWFYPYRTHLCPDLMNMFADNKPDKKSVFNMLLSSDSLCDSDKYSLALEAMHLTPSQRNVLFNHLDVNTFVQGMPNLFIYNNKTADKSSIVAYYFQDLHRFFSLCGNAKYMEKVDHVSLPSQDHPFYDFFLYDELIKIAEVSTFVGEYDMADMIYVRLGRIEDNPDRVEIWKKAALNKGKMKYFSTWSVVEYLDKALEIDPNEEWCLRYKAKLIKDSCRNDELEAIWTKLCNMHPESISTICSLAEAQMNKYKFEEALKTLFKADYMSDYNARVKRDLGWCYLRMSDYPKAKQYFKTVIKEEENPDKRDWLNLGHVYNLMKQRRNAVRCYRKALELYGDFKKFDEDFGDDMEASLRETNNKDIDSLFNDLVIDAIREIKE